MSSIDASDIQDLSDNVTTSFKRLQPTFILNDSPKKVPGINSDTVFIEFNDQENLIMNPQEFKDLDQEGVKYIEVTPPFSISKSPNATPKKALKKAGKYPCEFCSETFSKNANLFRHVETVHTNELHTCNACGKIFNRMDNLRRHTKTKLCRTRQKRNKRLIEIRNKSLSEASLK